MATVVWGAQAKRNVLLPQASLLRLKRPADYCVRLAFSSTRHLWRHFPHSGRLAAATATPPRLALPQLV